MKQDGFEDGSKSAVVAPYAGAWIETVIFALLVLFGMVAPYAGAWIETSIPWYARRRASVAPYAGAWIETRR